MEIIIPLLMATIITIFNLGILHSFGKGVCISCSSKKRHIIGIAIGITLGYLMLHLLPEVFREGNGIEPFLMLLGFLIFLLIEHMIYRHAKRESLRKNELNIHISVIFLFKLIHGALILLLYKENIYSSILFFISLFTIDLAEDFSLHFLKGKLSSKLVSIAPILGVLIVGFIPESLELINPLLAFISGLLLYVVSTELIPAQRKKHPFYLLFGLIIFLILRITLT